MPPPATAEQKIDRAIQLAPTSCVVIDLAAHGIDSAEVTPDLLDRYHTAGWRVADLTEVTLTLSN